MVCWGARHGGLIRLIGLEDVVLASPARERKVGRRSFDSQTVSVQGLYRLYPIPFGFGLYTSPSLTRRIHLPTSTQQCQYPHQYQNTTSFRIRKFDVTPAASTSPHSQKNIKNQPDPDIHHGILFFFVVIQRQKPGHIQSPRSTQSTQSTTPTTSKTKYRLRRVRQDARRTTWCVG